MLTELESRALSGDRKAQEECTKNGIVLPCPCCGGSPNLKNQKVEYGLSGTIIRCTKCGLYLYSADTKAISVPGAIKNVPIENHEQIGIRRWNTRVTPPIGRCEECSNFGYNLENDTYCGCPEGLSDPKEVDFCSYFKSKECED